MSSLFAKPSIPQLAPPPAPLLDPPPPVSAVGPDAVLARQRAERQARARQGRGSTILTSPTGLSPVTPIGSTLLGS